MDSIEAGSWKRESQKPEAGSWKAGKLEAGSRKPEAGSQKPEARSQKPESQKPEAGKPESWKPEPVKNTCKIPWENLSGNMLRILPGIPLGTPSGGVLYECRSDASRKAAWNATGHACRNASRNVSIRNGFRNTIRIP